MFENFKSNRKIPQSDIVTDRYGTSPGQPSTAITRNDLAGSKFEPGGEYYDRARQIYYRAKRSGRRRSAGII